MLFMVLLVKYEMFHLFSITVRAGACVTLHHSLIYFVLYNFYLSHVVDLCVDHNASGFSKVWNITSVVTPTCHIGVQKPNAL